MRLVREELATLNYWLVWHSCFFHLHVCYIAYSELGLWFDTELENNCVVTIRHGSSSLLVSDPPLLHPVILLRLGFVYRFLEKKKKTRVCRMLLGLGDIFKEILYSKFVISVVYIYSRTNCLFCNYFFI